VRRGESRDVPFATIDGGIAMNLNTSAMPH
jgi:hypothetical protein